MTHVKYVKYVIVTQWYDNAEVGSIWKIIETPDFIPEWKPLHVVEIPGVVKSKSRYNKNSKRMRANNERWIAKDCCKIITKEENPEIFI